MIAVIIGPPGAGKSSQSQLLENREHLDWLYVGKLLRSQNNPTIDKFIDAGQLVDDQTVNRLVADYMDKVEPSKVVVIDGFPRHLPQARWLLKYAQDSHHDFRGVVHLVVPAEVSETRLSQRGRDDDAPQILKRRLELYERDITPVIDYFHHAGVPIHTVDGNRSVEEVFTDIDRILSHVHQS